MQKTTINPWNWQENLGYSQAIETRNATHTLYCAGQAAVDEQGLPLDADMSAQLSASLDNLETVLNKAGYEWQHVIRLNYYTTSIEEFFKAYGMVIERLKANHCVPVSTLLEVKALAFPQLTVEIEATAVR